ncbi:MAG: hypothetical protein DSZ32_02565 [Gammaproteobacteria bacterium]|nr:MAG: hypothetical protein DSZ32_02565 [Gammaproteobacteria bacterium]
MIKAAAIFLVSLLCMSPANADVINHSGHVVYVDDEGLGMIWMLAPASTYHGASDAVASPFIRRRYIYKSVNGEDVEITADGHLISSFGSLSSQAARLLIGGWKDESWINGPHGRRFLRLFTFTR